MNFIFVIYSTRPFHRGTISHTLKLKKFSTPRMAAFDLYLTPNKRSKCGQTTKKIFGFQKLIYIQLLVNWGWFKPKLWGFFHFFAFWAHCDTVPNMLKCHLPRSHTTCWNISTNVFYCRCYLSPKHCCFSRFIQQ